MISLVGACDGVAVFGVIALLDNVTRAHVLHLIGIMYGLEYGSIMYWSMVL